MNRTAEEILDDLNETGEMPRECEVVALCAVATEGEWAQAKLEALQRTLKRGGWEVIDMTTDDDDGDTFELIPPQEAT